MLIYCKFNNNLQAIKIHKYSSLYHLKKLIKDRVKCRDYTIEYGGKILNYEDDNKYLEKFHIHDGSTINITRKIKGGTSFYMVVLIILCVILVFIIIPGLLFSGFVPFIIHIFQLFIFKIINCFMGYIFRLPRIAAHKGIIGFFVKCFMLFFSLFFMYYAVNLIFTIAFFLWVAVLKGGDGLFTLSSSYCDSVSTLNIMSIVMSIIFIIFYGALKAPNLLFKNMGGIISLTEKLNIGLIFKWLNPFYAWLKEFTYETKFAPFLLIPVFDGLMEGYFDSLDFGVNMITEYLGYIIQLGCGGNPIDVSSLTQSLGSGKSTNSNGSLVGAVQKVTKTQNLNFLKQKKAQGGGNCTLVNLDTNCCSDEMFQSLANQFQIMYNMKATADIMKELGIYKIMKVLIYGLNVKQVNEDMVKFHNAFGPFKLLDNNVKAPIATFFRYSMCNIFYLADFLQNTLFELGTPEDISDTIKCGFIGGFLTTIAYLICIIIIIFVVLLG